MDPCSLHCIFGVHIPCSAMNITLLSVVRVCVFYIYAGWPSGVCMCSCAFVNWFTF
jgi:hypothetical protein